METLGPWTDNGLNSQFVSESQKMEMVETFKEKEYYHITSLNELSSFKNWASSNVSDGRWQWRGFYMWSNKQDSNNHVVYMDKKKLIDKDNPAVRLSFKVTPSMCEPDYQYLLWTFRLNKFLTENLDIIKKIPYWLYKMTDIHWESYNIMFDKTILISWRLQMYIEKFGVVFLWEKDVVNGSVVTEIMHYFRDNYPEKYNSFVNSVEPPAVRYLWTRNIFPTKVEILNDNIWEEIDIETYFKTEQVKNIDNSWENFSVLFEDDIVL